MNITSSQIAQLCAAARQRAVQEIDLDEIVHDLAQQLSLPELNSLHDEHAQEDHITAVERAAAAINNAGIAAQLTFIAEQRGVQAARHIIAEVSEQ